MLLLDPARLAERKATAAPGGPLAPLAESLAADLEVLMSRELYVPREKALLSRVGGRCETDGTQLEFDPYSPDEHRCPLCGRVHTGEYHHRYWVYFYQLWLAERAVHAAPSVRAARRRAARCARSRDRAPLHCAMYDGYPNVDHRARDRRDFFSTYHQSPYGCCNSKVTADLLEATPAILPPCKRNAVRSEIARPSAAPHCAQYDEGMSNRQVWNKCAGR